MSMSLREWDDRFDNSGYVEGALALPEQWAALAAQYRASLQAEGLRLDIDVPYGDHPRERFDLIWPEGVPRGLVVFVHGGYWMRFDKSTWTHLAEGARAAGWAVCLPTYTLAPQARIAEITLQISRAIDTAAALVSGPIRLAGHSAGGHLVSRMICNDTSLATGVLDRVAHVVSISGLHDLRPLLQTSMNTTLRLDAEEATAESAALHVPLLGPSCTAWVGGGERPEFLRQARLLAMMWAGFDSHVRLEIDGTENHFTVIDALQDPASPLMMELLKP